MDTVFAAEVGGTFTDVILVGADGLATARKVPSNRQAPERSVFEAMDQLGLRPAEIHRFTHGTTVGTNTLLERTGARAALVVTKGFGDLLELQREWKDLNYDLRFCKPEPLIPRDRILELDCRLSATGEVVKELTEQELARAAEALAGMAASPIAVCLLNSYRSAAHERQLADYLAVHLPEVSVHLSSEVTPEIREFERASTTVLSAYIGPPLADYLHRMERRLAEAGFDGSLLITQCNGGLATVAEVEHNAAASLLSGPAAGVEGARHAARSCGITDFVTMDVGGTSTDLCLIENGQPTIASGTVLERWPVAIPLLDVRTVGAGGGSIVASESGSVQVGPRSAGAEPGPASYGRGGTAATLTDALVVTGFLRGGRLLGDVIPVDQKAAEDVFAVAAEGSHWQPEQLADAAVSVAVAELSHQVRLLTLEQGLDPRDFWLLAYGGAGPMFAGWVAAELGLRGVVVPAAAGLLSAVGLVVAPYRRDYTASVLARATDEVLDEVRGRLAGLSRQAQEGVRKHLGEAEVVLREVIDVRYVGQGFELEIELDQVEDAAALAVVFNLRHDKVFGYRVESDPIEVVRCRLTVEAALTNELPRFGPSDVATGNQVEALAVRAGVSEKWSFVAAGSLDTIAGPAVIESADSTVIVPSDFVARRQDNGSIIIER